MKRMFVAAMLLAAFMATPAFALGVGEKAPDIVPSKTWNDNGKKKLSDFQGEYVFVVFWATW